MLFQLYGERAGFQLLGWLLVFLGLILTNEIARRSKKGGIFFFLVLPGVLTVYFIAVAVGASMGAQWALNNPTYLYMNSWFHYAKLYAATIGCIGFMMLKYQWGNGLCCNGCYVDIGCCIQPLQRRIGYAFLAEAGSGYSRNDGRYLLGNASFCAMVFPLVQRSRDGVPLRDGFGCHSGLPGAYCRT